jgi:hypothetical protein
MRTKDDALIYVENKGIRWGKLNVLAQLARGDKFDPSNYYLHTAPQSGEPLATASQLYTIDQEIYHDTEHPSALVLPVKR